MEDDIKHKPLCLDWIMVKIPQYEAYMIMELMMISYDYRYKDLKGIFENDQ